MKETQQDLAKLLKNFTDKEGFHQTPIPGVYCLKYSAQDKRTKRRWHSCFAIIAQGSKEIVLGEEIYRASESHYTAAPVDLPVISRIVSASAEKPFLSILISFDSLALGELEAQLEPEFQEASAGDRAIFVGKADGPIMQGALRLAQLLDRPQDAQIVGPLIIKEMFYYLLKGPNGPAIRQFVQSGSKMQRVAKAIHKLKSDLNQEINIPDLARIAKMSRSTFFKHFKETTSMSPIQYQKRLRLLEARRLMISENETAEGAAYRVGYNSPFQFSREYSRMFGKPPMKDVLQIKKTGHLPANVI